MITFILSSGRTGTVFLNNVVKNIPGITSKHERHGRVLRILNNLKYSGMSNSLFDKIALLLIVTKIKKYKDNSNVIHIEINNMIKYYINDVYKKFPDANYIHIVRDPREHIASAVSWAHTNPISRLIKLYVPYSSPSIKKIKGENNDTVLSKMALENWKSTNKLYSEIENVSNNYHLLKFEDLKKDSVKFIKIILKISGYKEKYNDVYIEEAVRQAGKNASKNKGNNKHISNKYIREQCSQLMNKFGY